MATTPFRRVLAIPTALALALAGVVVTATPAHAATVPLIDRVSDSIEADESISITGWDLTAGNQQVAIKLDAGNTSPSTPPSGSSTLTVVQTDQKGNFVVALMPGDAPAGVYNLWVRNATGWSTPVKLNQARPQWVSEKEAWEGQTLTVVGRNLLGSEFGAADDTLVRLTGSGQHLQTVESANPYGVEFTITGATPDGEYAVEVSNDGGAHWAALSSGQRLNIVDEGADPLGLDVAWAGNFDWANRVDVTDHSVVPNSGLDETARIQAVLDDVGDDADGGVVYFPNGTYRVDSLQVPESVVLLGESRAGTVLAYIGTVGGTSMIESETGTGRTGIADLTLTIAAGVTNRPDIFIQLGEAWGDGSQVGNLTERVAEQMFLKNVKIDYDLSTNRTPEVLEGSLFGSTPAWAQDREFAAAFDGDPGTFFDYTQPDGGIVGTDLGAGNADRVGAIRYAWRSGQAQRMVGGEFQGSNSLNSGWVTLAEITSTPDDPSGWEQVGVSDRTPYRYLRYVSPDNSYGNVAEIAFVQASERGYPVMTLGRERFIVQDSEFIGFAGYAHNYVSQYSELRDTHLKFSHGVWVNSAEYYLAQGNVVEGNTQVNAEKHGLSLRSSAYVYDNTIRDMVSVAAGLVEGHDNDGEAIMSEAPGGYFNYGTVTSAGSDTITVNAVGPLTLPNVMYSYPAVQIVEGEGLGQLRRIESVSGSTITVTEPWDRQPDATSKFTLISPNENVTAYRNTIEHNDKGIWLFGNAFDSVVVDNAFTDSEGVFIWAVNVQGPGNNVFTPGYFNRVADNSATGVSPLSLNSGFGLASERFNGTGAYYGVLAFGNEFRGNDITGTWATPVGNAITEAPDYPSGIYVSTADIGNYDQNNSRAASGDTTHTIIEGNHIASKAMGVKVTHNTIGTVIRNNSTTDVTTFLVDTGGHDTLDVGNGTPSTPVKLSGTAFGSAPAWAPDREFGAALDGDTASFFDAQAPDDGYAGIDLGSGNATVVTSVRFFPRAGQEGRMDGGVFQGSNTSATSGFTTIATVGSGTVAGWSQLTVTDTTAYRYLRYIAPANAYGNVAEIEFYG